MVNPNDAVAEKTADISFSQMGGELPEPIIMGMMIRALNCKDAISLAAGFTDNHKLPLDIISRAADALKEEDGLPTYLQYGTNQGRPRLRELLAEHMGHYPNESKYDAEGVMVTNGSQQALYLAMQVLCDRGDIVLVEGPSYFVFLEMLRGLGIRAVSMPLKDGGGVDTDALVPFLNDMKARGDFHRIKASYVVSYYANPTGHTMSLDEKESMGRAFKEVGLNVPVIEDAAYRDMYFDKPSEVPSIHAVESLQEFPRLYTSTLSKSLSSGLKMGYSYCSHEALLAKMLYVKGHQDFGTANYNQALVEKIFEKGWYGEWLNALGGHYKTKAEAFEEIAAEEKLSELGWRWNPMDGGMMVWVRGQRGITDTSMDSPFWNRALENGVFYVPGDLCFSEGEPKHCARLSVGTLDLETLREGIRRFAKTAREFAQ